MITLAIDYGASNIGIALVRNTEEGNEPLFAGTIIIDAKGVKDLAEPRAAIRRLRRTRKTKIRRLRQLSLALKRLGLGEEVSRIVRFARRRGYKSLFDDPDEAKQTKDDVSGYRCTREEFFHELEHELQAIIIDTEQYHRALSVCERVLNRRGERYGEIRPLKIDNRGRSRCAWEGCNRVTPRRHNATDDVVRQQLVTYFQSPLRREPGKLPMLEQAVVKLDIISKNLRGSNEAKCRNALDKRARTILRGLQAALPMHEDEGGSDKESWEYVEKGIVKILENAGGRNRYCREHSKAYCDRVLEGKPSEFKSSIQESDIISRREQIIFNKLWRYIEARLLPLAPEGIDRIVVERTAFDLLAGKQKKIRDASSKSVESIYQYGPRYGFTSEKEMLRKEFGGLCAYCGKPSETLLEREHILPRRLFFFDSYLNILPSCPQCNAAKGTSLPGVSSLRVHEDAYRNYESYINELKSKRPLHFLHTEKKGILNLMRDPERAWDWERYLRLIANNFASIVQTQRGPRPFARYLYSKLSRRQEKPPEIAFRSGRHTALYRSVAYPDFSKAQEKAGEDGNSHPVNHALDALLLASKLPRPEPLEARGLNHASLKAWADQVRGKAAPAGEDGIPVIPAYKCFVPGFEETDAHGYVTVEMAMMNWNKKDTATTKQDPYGWSESRQHPTKRVSARTLFDDLREEKSKKNPSELIKRIYHPALRSAVEKAYQESHNRIQAAEALKNWLRDSVKNSLRSSSFSRHPSDIRRRQDLERFANGKTDEIPVVIGIKCLDTGVAGKIDAARMDRQTGTTGHRYLTDPANRGVVLAYPTTRSGACDRRKPCTAGIRQNYSLKTDETAFRSMPASLERGVVWGKKTHSPRAMESAFSKELEQYLRDRRFHSYCILTAGCVVCYEDGTERFIRNFDKSKGFKKTILRNIVALKRTPLSTRVVPLKVLTALP